MSTKRWVMVVGVICVSGFLLTSLLFWLLGDDSSDSPTQRGLSIQEAERLENYIESPLKTEQAKALVPEKRLGEWQPEAVLPHGATLEIHAPSFIVDGAGSAHVDASVTGTTGGEFVLYLRYIDQQWLVDYTEVR